MNREEIGDLPILEFFYDQVIAALHPEVCCARQNAFCERQDTLCVEFVESFGVIRS